MAEHTAAEKTESRSDGIETVLRSYPPVRENLIAILQDIQELEGFLSRDAIIRTAEYLNMASGKVYGVATFYNQFKFRPTGVFHLQICRGTACHVKGSAETLDLLERELGIHPGETSADGMFSLETVPCLGACGLAPVLSVNGEIYAGMNCDGIRELLNSMRKSGSTGEGA